MGACEFVKTGRGKSAGEVFAFLVEQAQYEHGHGGYTGTIAEKKEFRMAGVASTRDELRSMMQEGLAEGGEFCEKYGPAGCIEHAGDLLKVREGLRPDHKVFTFFGWASE